MSERLNSVDIEDVLSSIRRLVSDDLRPAAKAAVPPAAPVEPPQADKLILTPALRIAPEADEPGPVVEAEPADAAQASEAAPSEPVMSFHSVRPERGAARLDAVMGQVARELESGPGDWETAAEPPARFESDWSEAEADLAPAAFTDDTVADAAEPLVLREAQEAGDVWTVAESEAPYVDLDSDYGAEAVAQADLTADAADLAPVDAAPTADLPAPEMAVPDLDVLPGADAPDQAIDDSRNVTSDMTPDALADPWPDQDWAAPGEPDLLLDADAPAEAGWSEAAAIDSQPVAMAEEPAMTDKDDPADLPDWARMETEPVDADPVDLEPPAAPAAGQKGSTDPRWADAAEAEIRRELEDEVTASAFARFADDDLDDRPFDEEMLRDLVRDIIREELQGALGERITRNVRKLVRAEIARALAVRDFE
jgi:hypothetical protein